MSLNSLNRRLELIEQQFFIITEKYMLLKMEYEKNCLELDRFIPKIGKKRKRWQAF